MSRLAENKGQKVVKIRKNARFCPIFLGVPA